MKTGETFLGFPIKVIEVPVKRIPEVVARIAGSRRNFVLLKDGQTGAIAGAMVDLRPGGLTYYTP